MTSVIPPEASTPTEIKPARGITRTKNKKPQTPEEAMKSGIALAVAFFGMSIFLYLNPAYLGNTTVSTIVSILLAGLSAGGLGVELNKLGGKEEGWGIENLGFGILMGCIWLAMYYYLPILWINIPMLAVLLFALYGIALGFINVIVIVFTTNTSSTQGTLLKIALAIAQVVAFVAALLQALQILKILVYHWSEYTITAQR